MATTKLTVPILLKWNDIEGYMAQHDIVEVVRCKDCAYKQYYFTNNMVKCGCGNGAHHEGFFCADGERRTDDDRNG